MMCMPVKVRADDRMMVVNELIEIESAPCLLYRPIKISATEQGSSWKVSCT